MNAVLKLSLFVSFIALSLVSAIAPVSAEDKPVLTDEAAIAEGVEEGLPLPDVVVTANRRIEPVDEVTYPIQVVTEKQIEEQGAQTAIDVLNTVPGISVSSGGAPGDDNDIRIMGSDRDEVLVLIDGVPVNTVVDNRPTILGSIPADNIARIEVLEGAHSGMYGSRAVGGVINIITKEAGEGFATDFGFKGGNLGRFIEDVGFELGRGNNNLRVHYQRWDQAGRFSNDRSSQNAATLNWRYHISDELSIQMMPQYINTGQQLAFDSIWDVPNGTVYYPRDDNRSMRRDTLIAPVSLILNMKKWWEAYLDYSYWYQFVRLKNPPSANFAPAPFPGDQYVRSHEDRHRASLRNVFIPLDKGGYKNLSTIGFDVDVESLSFIIGPFNGPHQQFPLPGQKLDRQNYAVYVQNVTYFKDYAALVAGFRYDNNSMNGIGSVLTARASVMGQIPQSKTKFKFSYSETFNAPLVVLVMTPGVVIQKETAQNYSAGFEQPLWDWGFLSSFFFYKDYDSYFSDAADPVGTTDAYAMGVETIFKLFPINWFRFQGSYTWTRTRDETRDVPLPQRPLHMVKTSMTFLPIKGLSIRSDLQYIGKQYWGTNTGLRYVDSQGLVSDGTLDPYVLWDITGRYAFDFKNSVVKEVALFTSVNNILNQSYQLEYGRPMPGINFLAGFSGKFF